MRTRNSAPPTNCTLPDCDRPHLAKGFCQMHYARNRKFGDPRKRLGPANGEAVAFAQNLIDNGTELVNCIYWPFARSEKGHAVINMPDDKRKIFYTSRHILESREAPPSDKHLTLHSCHNGHLGCVNPNHLYWGTQADNTHDMVVAGNHPTQKITPEIAQAIWDCKGTANKHAVAARFPPATDHIVANIWYSDGWQHHIKK